MLVLAWMQDFVTLLACADGHTAQKRFTEGGGVVPYDVGYTFTAKEIPIEGIDQVSDVFSKLSKCPQLLLIRGKLKAGLEGQQVRRKCNGEGAAFEEHPHHWVMIDVDGGPWKSVQEAVQALGEPFAGCSYAWAYSSSHGLKPGLRAHLFFWLGRALNGAQLESWSKEWGIPADVSLFRTVQPHYLADPLFEGVVDPVPVRWGFVRGTSDTVAVPELPDLTAYDPTALAAFERKYQAQLNRILKSRPSCRRNDLHAAAYAIGGMVPHLVSRSRAERDLWAAVAGAKWHEHKTDPLFKDQLQISESLDKGQDSPWLLAGDWRRSAQTHPDDPDRPIPSIITAVAVLSRHGEFKGRSLRNVRGGNLFIDGARVSDGKIVELTDEIHRVTGVALEPKHVWAALDHGEVTEEFDPVREHLETLQWDGVDRMGSLFPSDQDPRYVAEIVKRWLISAVARTYVPGCQADHCLILIGAQGQFKSQFWAKLSTINGKSYLASLDRHVDKDAVSQAHEAWIVELAEMATLHKSEIGQIKHFVTNMEDRWRPPYGRSTIIAPRRFVLCGTMNPAEFVTDPSGARRWWPIHVAGSINLEFDPDQVWAQAVDAYKRGEAWHVTDPDILPLLRAEQRDLDVVDSFEERLMEWLDSPIQAGGAGVWRTLSGLPATFSLADLERAVGPGLAGLAGQRFSAKANATLVKLGWEKSRERHSGSRIRIWRHADRDPELDPATGINVDLN